jgi:hypothetical protein
MPPIIAARATRLRRHDYFKTDFFNEIGHEG